MLLRTAITACLATAAVALVLVLPQSTPSQAETTASRRTPLQWGLYQILHSRKFGDQLDTEIASFASRPNYVMFYRDLGRPFPKSVIDQISKRGATTIVSLELWQWHRKHFQRDISTLSSSKDRHRNIRAKTSEPLCGKIGRVTSDLNIGGCLLA